MRLRGCEDGKRSAAGLAGLAPFHVLAIDRDFIDHTAVLVDLAHADTEHLAHPQAHLQGHFKEAAVPERIAPAETFPDDL
jgi:hypothetical protein